MTDLRSKTIRLAYARPELRPVLLPLLKEAAPKLPKLKGLSPKSQKALDESVSEWAKKPASADYSGGKVKKEKDGSLVVTLPKVLADWSWLDRRSSNADLMGEALVEWVASKVGATPSNLDEKYESDWGDPGSDTVKLSPKAGKQAAFTPAQARLLPLLKEAADPKGDLIVVTGEGVKRVWKKGITKLQADKLINDWEKLADKWEADGGGEDHPLYSKVVSAPMQAESVALWKGPDGEGFARSGPGDWERLEGRMVSKRAAMTPSQALDKLLRVLSNDSGGNVKPSAAQRKSLEAGIKKMMDSGMEFDSDTLEMFISEAGEQKAYFGKTDGYKEVDRILNDLLG